MESPLFVSGISTDVGKTLVSAVLVKATNGCYFKPVQSGIDSSATDSQTVRNLCSSQTDITKIFPESYLLTQPLSPHLAATIDNVVIKTENILLPKTSQRLIVEGAGGLMVPLNNKETIFDLLKKWRLPVVLVSNFYLGSINHTLLSLEILQANNIPIYGIVFNGEKNETNNSSVEAIENLFLHKHKTIKKFFIPQLENVNEETISQLAQRLKQEWQL